MAVTKTMTSKEVLVHVKTTDVVCDARYESKGWLDGEVDREAAAELLGHPLKPGYRVRVERLSKGGRLQLSLWLRLPLMRRCHTSFIESLEDAPATPSSSPNKPHNEPPGLADLEERLPFVLCPFQRKGVIWMARQEAFVSSITKGIFRKLDLQTCDGKPLFGSKPNPSETIVWPSWPVGRSGGFLADEPGLGKTVQMVSLMNLCGFHFRDTPGWVKGAYGEWLRPMAGPRYVLRRYKGTQTKRPSEVLLNLKAWETPDYPWHTPDVPLGGTLIVFPTTLSGQWEDELRDKSVEEGLAILNLTKAIGVSEEALVESDVVLVTHGMLRAERRRSSERIAWGEAWACKGWVRTEAVDQKHDWSTLEQHDLIGLMPWGTEVLVDHVDDDGQLHGWPWSKEKDKGDWADTIGPPTTADQFSLVVMDWVHYGSVRACGHANHVPQGALQSSVACEACGAKPSPNSMKRLCSIAPSPLFRIWWRRIILDESDRLTSMPQTLNDVALLHSHVLWCLTGTPNGTDPRFGHNFLQQLSLFFVNGGYKITGGIEKDVGLALQEWRDPAFQGDLVDMWMLRRTKAEVNAQLSMPPMDVHTLEVVLDDKDGKAWIDAMHKDMAAIGSTRFGRLWRVLTIQEGLDSVILVDNMEVDLEGPGEDCPVCMDKIEDGKCVKTPCGHFFCKTCIQTWMTRAPSMEIPCPACRYPLTAKNLMLALEPAVEDAFTPGNLSKLRAIQTLLPTIPLEERVLIATRYPEAMATLARVLGCPSLHSKMSKGKRDKILRQGWTRCLVISMNLHGFGLNLTQANHLILVDEPSKPHHRTQLIGRIYRIGQKRHTHIYRLVTKGTLEEWVDTGTDLSKVMASLFR